MLGAQGGELLDRVVAADDPGVVVGTVASARDEHLGLGRPDLPVLTQDVGQRRVLARPRPVLLHDLVDDPALDHQRERPRLGVELAVQLLVDAQPLAGTVVPRNLLDPQVERHVHPVDEPTHRAPPPVVVAFRNHYIEGRAACQGGAVEPRSGCPINAAVEVLGDRWSLLVLRDIIFEDRRYFRALLTGSIEGIASNILADRLVRLVDAGILTRGTAARGQRARYSLTEAGIQTVPILYALGDWGLDWRAGSGRTPAPQQLMHDEGPQFLEEIMDELRVRHLDASPKQHDGPGPLERLRAIAG